MRRDHGGASRPGPAAPVRVPGRASRVLVLRGLQGRQSLLHRVSVGPRRPEPDSDCRSNRCFPSVPCACVRASLSLFVRVRAQR